MAANTPITIQQLANAQRDATDLERYVNDVIPALVQSRIGGLKPNYAKLVADFEGEAGYILAQTRDHADLAIYNMTSFVDRGAWAPLTAYQRKDVVTVAGIAYVTLEAHTSSEDFSVDLAAGLWQVFQGVNRAELADGPGSSMVGFLQAGTNSQPMSLLDRGRYEVWLGDKVGASDAALADALLLPERVEIPASTGAIDISAERVASILAKLNVIAARGLLELRLPAGVVEVNSAGALATIGQNENVVITGAAPIAATLESVVGVSGAPGAWSVVLQLSTDQAQVGQVLQIRDMPGGITYFQGGSPRRRYDGELAVGNNRMGTITTSGTTCTLSIGTQDANLAVGDLVHIQGQTRVVTGIDPSPAKTFTINQALDKDVSGYQWWYYTLPAAGTISTSGRVTAVTGSGTSFTGAANPGDFILADGIMAEIGSIESGTGLTLVVAENFAPGTPYTIVRGSVLHEGSFEITSVDGFNVTVRNRCQVRPPVNGVVGGAPVSVIRTVLKQRGTGPGLLFERGAILRELRNVALVGSGLSESAAGLAMNGVGQAYNQGNSAVYLGENSAVLEWGYGAFMSAGCVLFGWKTHICNNLNAGVEAIDGASWYLRQAVISHNRDIGILSSGGYGRVSEARVCGNRLQGVRQDVGSAIYGDSVFLWGNGSHGVLGVNRSGIQCADGYIIKSGGNGINQQNGAGGRFSRMLVAGSAQHALTVDGCHDVEITQGWLTGSRAGQSGMVCSHGTVKFGNGASTGNAAAGLFAQEGGRIFAQSGHSTKNGTNGARSDSQALIQITGGRVAGNVGADVARQGGTVTTDTNPFGTWQQGAVYSRLVTIADDAVYSIDLGDATVSVEYVSGSSTALTGKVRARAGAGGGSISQAYGAGITILQNTVLTGTTGVDGDVTMSVSSNGFFYVENRAGASRAVTLKIMGAVNK
ncbi:hypothetical protein [Bordetella genomosp. 12]|uniref:Uncharacterized protein n=1 Tax=Bordetella genomosp. 12 TaxID=463035 RepID=A0A261VN08_9BORD|nr:hypothetical protein [Bordetella genomosp. 12]OZI74593.1 hypothetical protein CAL22_09045 [Bordetella genomosp. 12]